MTDIPVPQGLYPQVAQQAQISGLAAFGQPQQQQQTIQQQQIASQHQLSHPVPGTPLTESQTQLQVFWPKQVQAVRTLQPNDFRFQELPLARIKKIMKQDEEVKMISAEAPVLFSKAAEMFVAELSLRAWIHTEDNKRRTLQRNDVAMAISKFDQFDFLIDIVPREELKPTKRFPTTMVDSSQMQYFFQLQNVLQQQQQQSQQLQAGQALQHQPHTQTQPLLVQSPIQFQVQPQVQLQQQQQSGQLSQLQTLGGSGQSVIIQTPGQVQGQQQPHMSASGVVTLPHSVPVMTGMWSQPQQQGGTSIVSSQQAHTQQQIILQQSQHGEQPQAVTELGIPQTIQYVLPQSESGTQTTYLPLYSSPGNPTICTPTTTAVQMVGTPVDEQIQDSVAMTSIHSRGES